MKATIEAIEGNVGPFPQRCQDEFGGFMANLGKGDAIVIPPGYVVLIVSVTDVDGMRWGFLSSAKCEAWATCAQTLRSFLDAYPASRTEDIVSWGQHLVVMLS